METEVQAERHRMMASLYDDTSRRRIELRGKDPVWHAVCSVVGHTWVCMVQAVSHPTNHWAWFQWYWEFQGVGHGKMLRQVFARQLRMVAGWIEERPDREAPTR